MEPDKSLSKDDWLIFCAISTYANARATGRLLAFQCDNEDLYERMVDIATTQMCKMIDGPNSVLLSMKQVLDAAAGDLGSAHPRPGAEPPEDDNA